MPVTRTHLEFRLSATVRTLGTLWQRVADEALAAFGISHSLGWALVHLSRAQARGADALRQADLAVAVGVTEASLVRTLHQLEHLGLVLRQTDPDDRRSNRLALTGEGADLAQRIDTRLTEMRHDLLAGIPDADLAMTIDVLDRVFASIGQRIGARPSGAAGTPRA